MLNTSTCPFCKKNNNCQVNEASCWCSKTPIPKELIELLPSNREIKSCICKECVENFTKDSLKFKTLYFSN